MTDSAHVLSYHFSPSLNSSIVAEEERRKRRRQISGIVTL